MTKPTFYARVLASCAVLCVAAAVFAQPAKKEAGEPTSPKDDSQLVGEDKEGNKVGQKQEKPQASPMGKCPVMGSPEGYDAADRHTAAGAMSNGDWWPNSLNLDILHQNSRLSNPLSNDFDYAAEFESLDLAAVKKDIKETLTK